MTHPRDPDEVDQTLLPGAPPANGTHTDNTPAAHADATLDPRPADPEATIESAAHGIPSSAPRLAPAPADASSAESTNDDVEATRMPSGTAAVSVDASDPGATLAGPAARTVGGTGAVAAGGVRSSDTAPVSHSGAGSAGRASPSATGTMVGRFALRELHAKGGLGEVFTARDTELNREVAVKRIKGQYADDPGSRRRFLTEAELTARLDHPGVVPVFGLVNDVRGRPCYAMRFIRGETLKDEIERYHGTAAGSKTPEPDRTEKSAEKPAEPGAAATPAPAALAVPRTVAFRNLLQRFIATCQTIAYAHTKNIIHRDIKPANIMVGAFGETLVVDWGLAKSLLDGPDFDRLLKAADEAGFRHDAEATELPSHITQAGTAVGTPAYMAPEQAAGHIEKVGPKADIYALGATLYAILTGKAPFSGKTAVETLDRVRKGEFESPTKLNPECPKPLEAIVRKAMALNPDDRYATALDLAADVERWESDEPVSCYRDPLFARVARWGRRHPAGVAATVSLLFAGILAAGAVAWVMNESEKKTSQAYRDLKAEEEKTQAALKQVTQAQGETQAALGREKLEREKAEGLQKKAEALQLVARNRYVSAVASYNKLVGDIDAMLADRAGMQKLRTDLLLNAIDGLEKLTSGAKGDAAPDTTLVAAHRQLGEVYQSIGRTPEARVNFDRAVTLAYTVQKDSQRQGATPAERRDADLALGRSLDRFAGFHLQMGETEPALTKINEAVKLFEDLVAANTNDTEAKEALAAARARRGAILMERGDTGGAAVDYSFALGARETLATAARTDPSRRREELIRLERAYAASLDDLAAVQLRSGRADDALQSAAQSRTKRIELAALDPTRTDLKRELAAAHGRLGDIHLTRGNTKAAGDEYAEGVRILDAVVKADEQNAGARAELADLLARLARVRLRTGDIKGALENTEIALDRALKLYEADSSSTKAKRDLAQAREARGDALLAADQTDEALDQYQKCVELLRPLAAEGAGAKLALAHGLECIGDAKLLNKDTAGAGAAFDESVKLRREVATADKDSATAKRELAVGLFKQASALCDSGARGATARAVPLAMEATDLFARLAELDQGNKRVARDLALAFGKWGTILASDGRATTAIIVSQRSFGDLVKLSESDSADVQLKEEAAIATELLASHYSASGLHDKALETANEAVKRWKDLAGDETKKTPYSRARLALALLRCGEVSAAAGKFPAARALYKDAEAEIAPIKADPLGKKVEQQLAERVAYLDAVEAVRANPADVLKYPAAVRVPALVAVATFELSAGRPVDASTVIDQLAKIAESPADKFAAARLYARCVLAPRDDDFKKFYADKAVEQLKAAVAAEFNDAEALAAPEWVAVGAHNKELAGIIEKLKAGKK